MKRSSSFTANRRGVLAASAAGVAGLVVAAAPLLAVSASATQPNQDDQHKVTICHRTNSVTNPYVKITVDKASVDGIGGSDHNGKHNGPVFDKNADYSGSMAGDQWGDIIPGTYVNGDQGDWTPKNWDAAGQEIWNNGCKVAGVSPSDDPSDEPSEESSQESSEEPSQDPSSQAPSEDPSSEAPQTQEPSEDPSSQAPSEDPSQEPSQEPSGDPSQPVGPGGSTEPSQEPSQEPSGDPSTPVDPGTPAGTTSPSETPVDPGTADPSDPGLPSTGGTTPATLPQTGSDTAPLVGLGLALVTLGAVTYVVARRRTEVEVD